MVGLFINTLPLRAELPPGKSFAALIRDLQERQSRLMAHQHLGLSEIQTLAGLGELFDTLTVFRLEGGRVISLEEEYTNISADMRTPLREALLAAQQG